MFARQRQLFTAARVIGLAAGLTGCVLGLTLAQGQAQTARWSRAGDSLTIDPHSQNEGATHGLAHQYYEPLLIIGPDGHHLPTLATSWAPDLNNPSVWRFQLRRGVKFHEGQTFTARDAKFSFDRARKDTADMREVIGSIAEVRVIDDHTIDIVTNGPDPILPQRLVNLFMMNEEWARENDSLDPQDFASDEEKYATRHANGTGPYRLTERKPDDRTVLERFDEYWGRDLFPIEVERIVYLPIKSAPTRVAALVSGDVDILQDVPIPDIRRLQSQPEIRVNSGPENRSIFLGMNQGSDDLTFDDVNGRNPFADVRVRRALSLAIDRSILKRVTMRGNADPSGVIIPPFVNGWTNALQNDYSFDLDQARELLSEAGYPDGFGVTLHCPNNRYVNDEAICNAVAGMIGRIGVRVTVDARPKAQHFKELLERKIDFYMLGWGVPTYDSGYVFDFLFHTSDPEAGDGTWNATGYSNATNDATMATIRKTVDIDERNGMIADVWQSVQAAQVYLPLHNQMLSWAMNDDYDIPVHPENTIHFKFVRVDD